MGAEWLAIIMFAPFLILILSGYPVAFSFAGTAIVFFIIGYFADAVDPLALNGLFNQWFGNSLNNFTFLAIPFFVFMGAVFEKSGLAERLLTTIGMAMGPLRGGMAVAVVFVGTLLAAATGVVAATVIVKVSRLRICASSWAMTPASSSRVSSCSRPWVTATAA